MCLKRFHRRRASLHAGRAGCNQSAEPCGSAAQVELRAAAVGYPDPAVVVAPGAVEDAVSLAELAPQLDTAVRVSRTEMTSVAIGFANDDLSAMFALALVISFPAGDDEIGTATIGNPTKVTAFVSPRLPFDAGRP